MGEGLVASVGVLIVVVVAGLAVYAGRQTTHASEQEALGKTGTRRQTRSGGRHKQQAETATSRDWTAVIH